MGLRDESKPGWCKANSKCMYEMSPAEVEGRLKPVALAYSAHYSSATSKGLARFAAGLEWIVSFKIELRISDK